MLDWLIDIDRELLLLCNSVHTHWLDNFFWIMSTRWLNIIIALPFLFILLHRRVASEALLIILAVALTVLLCDQIASSIFKPLFHRLRPTHEPSFNGYTGGRYGFISSHAANAVGVATFLLKVFRNRYFFMAILSWAVLVSYSRIFLGVHYPGDVLCGAAVGVIVGWAVYKLYARFRAYLYNKGTFTSIKNPYMLNSYAYGFAITILSVILAVAIMSCF